MRKLFLLALIVSYFGLNAQYDLVYTTTDFPKKLMLHYTGDQSSFEITQGFSFEGVNYSDFKDPSWNNNGDKIFFSASSVNTECVFQFGIYSGDLRKIIELPSIMKFSSKNPNFQKMEHT